MNDHEFEQLAFANPWSDEPAFLAALAQDPARQALVDSLRQQDQRLLIEPPPALRDKLLAIASQPAANQPDAGSVRPAASNDNRWSYRWLPLAACLLLALTVTFYFFPEPSNDMLADNGLAANEAPEIAELQQAVLAHIYREESMLEPSNDSHFDLTTVNAHLAQIGMQLQSNEAIRTLEVTSLKDCVVAQNKSLHLVIRSTEGRPVSVLLIDSPPVEQEFPIDDARFHGFVMPTQRGNLVIVSERRPDPEARALQSLFAANVQ